MENLLFLGVPILKHIRVFKLKGGTLVRLVLAFRKIQEAEITLNKYQICTIISLPLNFTDGLPIPSERLMSLQAPVTLKVAPAQHPSTLVST